MRIRCPGCSGEFKVDENKIPPHGATVRCPKCFKAVDVAPPSEEDLLAAQLGYSPTPEKTDPGKTGPEGFESEAPAVEEERILETQSPFKPAPLPAQPPEVESIYHIEPQVESPWAEARPRSNPEPETPAPKPAKKPGPTESVIVDQGFSMLEDSFSQPEEPPAPKAPAQAAGGGARKAGTSKFTGVPLGASFDEAPAPEPAGGQSYEYSLQGGVDDDALGIERGNVRRQEREKGKGPSPEDIDFNSLLSDLPGGGGPADESYLVDSPGTGAGGESRVASPLADPFSMEELDFDKLEPAGPERGKGDPNTSLADLGSLEIDFDSTVDVPEMPRPGGAVQPPVAAPGTEAALAAGEAKKTERRSRKKAGMSPMTVIGLALLVLVVGGGTLLFTGTLQVLLELFGEEKKQVVQAPVKVQVDYKRGSMEYPSPAEYKRRAESLIKRREMNTGDNPRIEEETLWVLAWYRLFFPAEFAAEKAEAQLDKFARRYAEEGSLFADKLQAMKAASEEKWPEAVTMVETYIRKRDAKLDELISSKKLAPEVLREDRLLQAWIMYFAGKIPQAREHLALFLEASPRSLYGRFVSASLLMQEQKVQEAKATLLEMAQDFPEYTGIMLALVDVAMHEGQWDDAVAQAEKARMQAIERMNPMLEMKAYRLMVQALMKKGAAGKPKLQEILEKVVKQDTEAEDMVLSLSELYLDANKAEGALTVLSTCKTCQSLAFNLLMVRALRDTRMYERALQVGQSALDKNRGSVDLMMLLAELSHLTGRDNSSVNYLRDALNLRPEYYDASMKLTDLYLSLKKPAEARETLLRAERFHPEEKNLLEKLVEINLEMNDDSGAAAALRKLQALSPNEDSIKLRLVEVLVRLENFKEAVPYFDYLASKNLVNAKLRPGYAMALREMGREADAVSVLQQVLEDNPSDYATARNLADIYMTKKDFFKSRRYLEMARRIKSDDPEVYYLLGRCCHELEDSECTLDSLTKAVEMEQENLDYRVYYAKVLHEYAGKGKDKQFKDMKKLAMVQFNRIIKQYNEDSTIPENRKDPEIYSSRGQIYFEMGYYDKALEDYRAAVAMDMHRVDLLLSMGDSLFHINRYDDAVKYYREVLDSQGNKAHAYFYLGKINLLQNDRKAAKQFFLDCVEADDKAFPDAYRFLGNIYREERFGDMALKYYKEFLKHAPADNPAVSDVQATINRLQ